MTWEIMSRMLESNDSIAQTQQINGIIRSLRNSELMTNRVLPILDKDNLPTNNIGLSRAKKWLAKIFQVFESEIDGLYAAHNCLGSAIYYLEPSAECKKHYSLKQVYDLLIMDTGTIDSNCFKLLEEILPNMSANARQWFVRYWIRKPRNGINEGIVTKILAKHYNKPVKEVKKHLNFNSLDVVIYHYNQSKDPPCNLTHGKFVKPMLAKEVPMDMWPTNRIVDYKYDGNRYQIHKQGDNVIIFNRKGSIVTEQFQDVVERVREYEIVDCIMDGEIYPIKDDGSPAEHKLMGTRVHSKDHAEAREKVKVKWVMFDCLKYDGVTVMDFPYWHRLEFIKRLPDQAHRMAEDGDTLAFYNQAINDGFEGIIVKDSSSPYEAGKRSIGWAKYKPPRINLDVVIVKAKYGQGNRSNVFGTFEIAVKNDTEFVSVGSVGSGFSDEDLIKLTNTLRRNVISFENKTFELAPKVILEVTADLVSRDENNNLGLRFPRCIRIRDDKFVADINTLQDVEALE